MDASGPNPPNHARARERTIQRTQAAVSRLALADTSVEELLVEVSSLLRDSLGCERVGFFEEVDGVLALLAGTGWSTEAPPHILARCPDPTKRAVELGGLPTLAAALAPHGQPGSDGLVAGLREPNGRRAALVLLGVDDGGDRRDAADLVGLAAELVASGWARRQLEQDLRESEQRLVEAQELGHMGSYDWNILTDTNVWSDELYRIYGYEPQSFNASYDRFLAMLHPDDREKIQAVHQKAYQTLKPYAMEERVVHPDGSVRILASTGEVIADEQGRPVRMRGTCIDITDRRRVEAEIIRLDQAEVRRRHALEINDNVLQGLTSILWALESGVTSTAEEVTRRTLESARSMMSRLLDAGDALHAGELTRSAAPEPMIVTAIPERPVPAAPQPSQARPARLVLADDSEDIRLLLRLQLTAQGYDVVAEATSGPEAMALVEQHRPDVVLLDMAMPGGDGLSAIPGIRRVSPETKVIALSGFSASELAGAALEAGAMAYVEKGASDALLRALRDAVPELSSTAPPRMMPLVDPAAVAAQPPTDVDEIEVVLGQLVHELRTPATVVSGIADMLVRDRDTMPSATADELHGALRRNTAVLTELMDRVASGVRAASGQVERRPVALRALVEDTLADLRSLLGVDRVIVTGDPDLVAEVDPLRIRQVLTNLLTNAAKYAPASTAVEVAVGAVDGTVELSVRDQGPGVDPNLGQQIFRPFVRDAGERGGLGLGLYLSQMIARSHGGDLRVEANHPVGTRFVLSVPASSNVNEPQP